MSLQAGEKYKTEMASIREEEGRRYSAATEAILPVIASAYLALSEKERGHAVTLLTGTFGLPRHTMAALMNKCPTVLENRAEAKKRKLAARLAEDISDYEKRIAEYSENDERFYSLDRLKELLTESQSELAAL